MRNLRRIFETNPEFSLYWHKFLESELGRMYQVIPWNELIKSLQLKESHKGRGAYFSPQGKLALMFLKAYTDLSDRKLVEHLNGSFEFQMFCGIFLGPERLPDFRFVSKIRTELSGKLQISTVQQAFA